MFWKCLKIPLDDSFVSGDQSATNGSECGLEMTKLCMNE